MLHILHTQQPPGPSADDWGQEALKLSVLHLHSAESVFLRRVHAVIEANLRNANFGVDWLADEVHLSPRQLQRRLQASLRMSAAQYIRLLRLRRASHLLARRVGPVAEIAYAVGFRDPRHFARLFKCAFGTTPSGYVTQRRRLRSDWMAAQAPASVGVRLPRHSFRTMSD